MCLENMTWRIWNLARKKEVHIFALGSFLPSPRAASYVPRACAHLDYPLIIFSIRKLGSRKRRRGLD
jgi:hypothetical protein